MDNMPRTLRPGIVIHGRYQIIETIGEGGFGITYRVVDFKEKRVAALKEYMPREIAVRQFRGMTVIPQKGCEEQYERFRTRFLEEARVLYRYKNHPNIVSVHHLFYENNTAYYSMEFLEGKDLGVLLKEMRTTMVWQQLKPIMQQTVNALEVIHQSGMVHCDISPDNIFVQKNGQIKLIDFGAVKTVMKGQSSVIILKKGFAPLEQFASSGRLGPWTDIYALAVTIYYSYTGKMPPAATDRPGGDTVIWPEQMGMSVPSVQWSNALRKAMSIRIEDRYQNVRDFWNDLNNIEENRLLLYGIYGYFQGKILEPAGEMLLGTDPSKCQILYSADMPGISRVHMRFWKNQGKVMAMDMGSRYGSWLNGKKMTPGLVYETDVGDIVEVGRGHGFRIISTETR